MKLMREGRGGEGRDWKCPGPKPDQNDNKEEETNFFILFIF